MLDSLEVLESSDISSQGNSDACREEVNEDAEDLVESEISKGEGADEPVLITEVGDDLSDDGSDGVSENLVLDIEELRVEERGDERLLNIADDS